MHAAGRVADEEFGAATRSHHGRVFGLGLTDQEKHDLVEYVKSL
jgi:hypothetical protein